MSDLERFFVVRTTGNVCFDQAVASLEFAVSALGVKVIVVMGHSHCGTVHAALQPKAGLTPALKRMVKIIRSSLGSLDISLKRATKQNTRRAAKQLVRKSKVIKAAVKFALSLPILTSKQVE